LHQRLLGVTVINAFNNKIETLTLENFKQNLKFLDLRKNRLKKVENEILQKFALIVELFLSENPWSCDCSTVDLLRHVQTYNTSIIDYELVACDDGRLFKDLSSSDICFDKIYLVMIAGVLLGIVGLISGLFYKYNKNIKIWLYVHNMCMWFASEEEIDEDKIYDAFVVFATTDQALVEDLTEELEGGTNPFKLCVGVRDWPPGRLLVDLVSSRHL
jgi:protein toll